MEQIEENVIKPHLVKPMLEKVIYERVQLPQGNATINIKPEDSVDVRKVSEEVVRVEMTRSLLVTPANLLRVAVTMAVDIPVDSIAFSRLPDPKEYIKNSQPVRILASYVSNTITNLTINSFLGPIITPPNLQ